MLAAFLIIFSTLRPFGYQMYLVKSGSMTPSIMTGSVVINHTASSYGIGDVITFKTRSGGTVTHRVVNIEEKNNLKAYVVKGDANKLNDPQSVPAQSVNGRVLFSIPFAGYIIAFMRTLPGLLTFIVVTAVIIVVDEISSVKAEVSKVASNRKKTKTSKEEAEASIVSKSSNAPDKAVVRAGPDISVKQPLARRRLIQ